MQHQHHRPVVCFICKLRLYVYTCLTYL